MRLNEQIRVPKVRVIDENNDQRGIIVTQDALNMAREAGIDLVEVAPNSDPPVCRLMDYGKWKYDQKKKEHKARVKQHNVTLKEVRLRPKTDDHDRGFKVKKARAFLEKGDKVQFTMLFRGRELAHLGLAEKMLLNIVEQLADVSKLEVPPRKLGRRMTMMLAPDKVTAKQ